MDFSIDSNQKWQRLDRIIRKLFKNNSDIKLNQIYTRLRKWKIKVNNEKKKENYRVREWDKINIHLENASINFSQQKSNKNERLKQTDIKDIKQQIIFEDKNWIFWNKPSWIAIHPWKKQETTPTLNDYLKLYIQKNYPELLSNNTFQPSFCFRLDKDTSGIIIAAKTYDALKYLNKLIKHKKTNKEYIAIVKWSFPEKKIIKKPLSQRYKKELWKKISFVDEKNGKEAITKIKKQNEYYDKELWNVSLISIKIFTGRMHQIRVHLWSIGYPIIWDLLYTDKKINSIAYKNFWIKRQLLHSYKYRFFDVFESKNIEHISDIPESFKKFFK